MSNPWTMPSRGCCCCEMGRIVRWAARHGILIGERTPPLLAANQLIDYIKACEEALVGADLPLPNRARPSAHEALSESAMAGEFLSVAEIKRRRAQREAHVQEEVSLQEGYE